MMIWTHKSLKKKEKANEIRRMIWFLCIFHVNFTINELVNHTFVLLCHFLIVCSKFLAILSNFTVELINSTLNRDTTVYSIEIEIKWRILFEIYLFLFVFFHSFFLCSFHKKTKKTFEINFHIFKWKIFSYLSWKLKKKEEGNFVSWLLCVCC